MLQSEFMFRVKNLSNSIEQLQNLSCASASQSNIYFIWEIGGCDWTVAVNWNSSTAVQAQHIYLKAWVISKCDLIHIVQLMGIPNKTAYSSSYIKYIQLEQTALDHKPQIPAASPLPQQWACQSTSSAHAPVGGSVCTSAAGWTWARPSHCGQIACNKPG